MFYILKCTACGKEFSDDQGLYECKVCNGILDVEYDYQALQKVITVENLSKQKNYSMWRYLPLISVDDTHIENTLKIGWTPLYRAPHLEKLSKISKIFIKDEGVNPTSSLKDRASVVAVLRAISEEKPIIACSSTGNAASSLAGNAARMGLKSVIFVPKRVPIGKLTQLLTYGAEVIRVDGDYKAAFQLSKQAINHFGWYNRNAAINPHMVEGKKTVAFEIAEQLAFKLTDWVVVSVGDGCTIAGVYKGFYDLHKIGLINRIPKLLGVQSEGCAPFVKAYFDNKPIEETAETTLADSIAVGIPRNPTKALRAVSDSCGSWIAVSDHKILQAMQLLGESEGVFAEPAAAASLAGMLKAIENSIIKLDETVTIISTGNGLKDIKNASLAVGEPIDLAPDLHAFINYYNKKESL